MAPPSKKHKKGSSSGASDSTLTAHKFLEDPVAITRWNQMTNYKFHPGSFINFDDFSSYKIHNLANRSNISSLINFSDNNVEINHLMIKLFYANMNLDKFKPDNPDGVIWSVVCGKQIFITHARMASILGIPNAGIEFSSKFCEVFTRNATSHQFMDDNSDGTKSIGLRPTTRPLHRVLMLSLFPRLGNYDAVYKENFKALYAIYGDIQINWVHMIFDEILKVNNSN